jgi:aminopeptidase-like protein
LYGAQDIVVIAQRLKLPFHVIDSAATAFEQAGLALDEPQGHAVSGVNR